MRHVAPSASSRGRPPSGAAPYAPTVSRPSFLTMLWRGVRRRCAWCGGRGAFFTGFFAKQEHCRTCGIGWHRGYDGFELGALTVNVIITFATVIVAMVVGIVLTMPDIAVLPLVLGLIGVAIVLPLLVYPISHTIWQAVDLFMRPPGPGDDAPPPVR